MLFSHYGKEAFVSCTYLINAFDIFSYSLYTFEGTLVTDGKELENGQFYVAAGRDKFKKLAYSDLLFNKPIGMKRVNG